MKKKYLILRMKLKSRLNSKLIINPNIKSDSKEKINDPITPDKVLLGLIFVNFFHLKSFPNI